MKENNFLQIVRKAFDEAAKKQEWLEVRINSKLEVLASAKEFALKAELERAVENLPQKLKHSDLYAVRDYFQKTGENHAEVLYNCASSDTDISVDREELLIVHNYCTFGKTKR